MILSRRQQNEIFADIRAVKLDPADFDWHSDTRGSDSRDVMRLVHRPTGAHFDFSFWDGGGHWLSWKPMFSNGVRFDGTREWVQARGLLGIWLRLVKADDEAPDLWGEIRKERSLVDAASSDKNRGTFSPAEVAQVRTALADLQRYIAARGLDQQKRQELEARIKYLEEAATVPGARKIDWLNIFISQVLAMVVTGIVSPSEYGEVMRHAAEALRAVFELGVRLLGT